VPVADYLTTLLQSGLSSLASYLAAHVLLCLVPAFLIAGAMTALIPQETITRYLGRDAPKFISYPMAALGGFVLAVCSCTILPLFAGIYRKGAGLGPAVTFLFVGPAINILAVTYTGVAIGLDIALARIVLSVVFGIIIGLIMALLFLRDDRAHGVEGSTGAAFAGEASVRPAVVVFMILLVSLLVVGTLGIGLFTASYLELGIPVGGSSGWQETLDHVVPYDAGKGQEGISIQGVLLVVLLAIIGLTSWLGLNRIDEGFNVWSYVALATTGLTLLVAALRVVPGPDGVTIGLTGRFFAELIVLLAIAWVAWKRLDSYEVQEWLWETWRFVKQIFPLLIVGVFAAGVVRVIIPPSLIQSIAGQNTLLANLVGVVFGVFMYFPTLVEVPIARMFLELGMHRGPLLAYLIADPALSIQSILVTTTVIGRKKTWTYVGLVAVFSTLAGLIFGWFVDG
jgi:uncharacterized membrane protein YraQ (UPF0718 family)